MKTGEPDGLPLTRLGKTGQRRVAGQTRAGKPVAGRSSDLLRTGRRDVHRSVRLSLALHPTAELVRNVLGA